MAKPEQKKMRKIRDELIYDTIMALVTADSSKTVRPQDVATVIYKEEWQSLLKRVRLFARKLALENYIEIVRKGEAVDPDDFRGVYRMRVGENAAAYIPQMPES